ncbi:cytochrome P450, partial [Streptomyces sp. ET3-23]|uniref:cytochrome P450 n=1 Tax=Streptomyces sp. ET3-23 TaxID=2885643 RepID=UPI001D0F609A
EGRSLMHTAIAPGRLPVFGHAIALGKDPLRFLRTLPSLGPVVTIYLGPRPFFAITDPELAISILTDQSGIFAQGAFYDAIQAVTGDGVANIDGDRHRTHRRAMQPQFRDARVPDYTDAMRQLATCHMQSWETGQTIIVTEEMIRLCVTMIASCLFSWQMDDATARQFALALLTLVGNSTLRALFPWAAGLPLPVNRRFERAACEIIDTIDAMIQRHLDTTDTQDLFTALMAAHDAEQLNHTEVRDEIRSVMIAGSETLGATIAWILYHITVDPDLKGRVLDEIDKATPEMPLLHRVIRETQRLHAPVMITRKTVRRTYVGNVQLPIGGDVLLSPYLAHHNQTIYQQPDLFVPDRWLPHRSQNLPRTAFIPFGAGVHKCLGRHFAIAAIRTVVPTLLQRLNLELAPDHDATETVVAGTHPRHLTMTVRGRV